MRVAVCVKHAIDEAELKIDPSGSPILAGAVGKMSTFDKNAVEEGLRIRTVHGGEVVVFMVGSPESRKTLKEALAMGADRGVLILGDTSAIDTLRTASVLAEAIKKSGPFDLVVCSEGSSDTYDGQVPAMMAEKLNLPYAGYVKKLEVGGQSAKLERSLEDSVEKVESPTPMVVSVVSEVNEPRYPTLIQIMQAAKKPVEELKQEELVPPDARGQVRVLTMSAQAPARKHMIIEGTPDEAAAKLVDLLMKDGVLTK